MTVKARCPNPDCGQEYKVPEERLGRTVACQKCKQPFTLQALVAVPANSRAESFDTPCIGTSSRPTSCSTLKATRW